MEIDGLGGKLLDQLAREGMVTDPASLWELRADSLAELDGWGEQSAGNLVREIDGARRRPLHRLLFALGIPHVGERAARLLAQRFGSLDSLAGASPEELERVEGVGPVMAGSVGAWFEDERNRELVARLKSHDVDPTESAVERDVERPLEGLRFVITGALNRPRSAYRKRLEELGATVTSSVSSRTSYVVAGREAGGKLDRALALGIEVLDDDGLDRVVLGLCGRNLWER
jgi:DNA ligase (NAD+)